jgi:hypothetical protein
MFRQVPGPTRPPIQWVKWGALSPGVKRPRREADHSSPTSADVRNTWIYTSTPPHAFMAYCLISYAQGQTYLTVVLYRKTTEFTRLKYLYDPPLNGTFSSASNDRVIIDYELDPEGRSCGLFEYCISKYGSKTRITSEKVFESGILQMQNRS